MIELTVPMTKGLNEGANCSLHPRFCQIAEVSLLLALMCKYSCEESELVVYNGSAYCTVEVEKGTILDNMERVLNTDFTQVPRPRAAASWDEQKVWPTTPEYKCKQMLLLLYIHCLNQIFCNSYVKFGHSWIVNWARAHNFSFVCPAPL